MPQEVTDPVTGARLYIADNGMAQLRSATGDLMEVAPEHAGEAIASGEYAAASSSDVEQYAEAKAAARAPISTGIKRAGQAVLAAGTAAHRAAQSTAMAPLTATSAVASKVLGVEDPLKNATATEMDAGRVALMTELASYAGLANTTGEAAAERFKQDVGELAEENPTATTVGDVAGSVVGGAPLSGLSMGASTVAGRALLGAAEGGLQSVAQLREDAVIQDKELTGEQLAVALGVGSLLGAGVSLGLDKGAQIFRRAGSRGSSVLDSPRLPPGGGPYRAKPDAIEAVAARALGDVEPAPGLGRALAASYGDAYAKAASVASGGDEAFIRKAGIFNLSDEAQRIRRVIKDPDAVVEDAVSGMRQSLDDAMTATNDITEEVVFRNLKREHVTRNLADIDQDAAIAASRRYVAETLDELDRVKATWADQGERALGKLTQHIRAETAKLMRSSDATAADAYMAMDQVRRALHQKQKTLRLSAQRAAEPSTIEMSREMADLVRNRYRNTADLLMDESVWGAQGTAQKQINLAWVDYIKAREAGLGSVATRQYQDSLSGINVYAADDAKLASHFRAIGLRDGSLREKNLRDFVDASKRLSEAIGDGLDLPPEKLAALKKLRSAVTTIDEKLGKGTEAVRLANQFKALRAAEGDNPLSGVVGGAALGGPIGALLGGAASLVTKPGQAMQRLAAIEALKSHVEKRIGKSVAGYLRRVTAAPSTTKAIVRAPRAAATRGSGRAGRSVATRGAVAVAAPGTEQRRDDAKKAAREVGRLAASPEIVNQRVAEATPDIADAAPVTATAMSATTVRAIQFLLNKVPPGALQLDVLYPSADPEVRMSDSEAERFAKYVEAATNPLVVLDALEDGTLSREHIETLEAVYPRMLQELRSVVLGELAAVKRRPAYEARKNLDLLLGLNGAGEPSMSPQFMALMQSLQPEEQQPQQMQPRAPTNQIQIAKDYGSLTTSLERTFS